MVGRRVHCSLLIAHCSLLIAHMRLSRCFCEPRRYAEGSPCSFDSFSLESRHSCVCDVFHRSVFSGFTTILSATENGMRSGSPCHRSVAFFLVLCVASRCVRRRPFVLLCVCVFSMVSYEAMSGAKDTPLCVDICVGGTMIRKRTNMQDIRDMREQRVHHSRARYVRRRERLNHGRASLFAVWNTL